MTCKPCRDVEPLRLNTKCTDVKPAGEFNLENENSELEAIWAQEEVEASGTTIMYWSQNLKGATLDPLYNEPELREWFGPYEFKAFLEWPEQAYETREEGNHIEWTSVVWVPLLTVEESEMPEAPKEGDVVRVWNIPYFDTFAQGMETDIPNAGYYFDVIGVVEDGHFADNPEFTGFKCDLKRRTSFTPERRVLNQT